MVLDSLPIQGENQPTRADILRSLTEKGFQATRLFSADDNVSFQDYLKKLRDGGKVPHDDFTFVLGDASNEYKVTIFEKSSDQKSS